MLGSILVLGLLSVPSGGGLAAPFRVRDAAGFVTSAPVTRRRS
jgi:hypothetical protein